MDIFGIHICHQEIQAILNVIPVVLMEARLIAVNISVFLTRLFS